MKYSLSSSTNYRGISLFNAIGKVFAYAVLLIYNKCFQTSDFKQQHSTVMCSLLYLEVINHYLWNVYSCLLDTSKAFDRVQYRVALSNPI